MYTFMYIVIRIKVFPCNVIQKDLLDRLRNAWGVRGRGKRHPRQGTALQTNPAPPRHRGPPKTRVGTMAAIGAGSLWRESVRKR